MHNVHSHPQLCEHVFKVNLHYEGKFALSSSIIKKKEKKINYTNQQKKHKVQKP